MRAEPLVYEGREPRILPPITSENRSYWTGGVQGQLLIQRCAACFRWVHPPAFDACVECGGNLLVEPVSGRGSLVTYTINERQFHPQVEAPYVVGVVQLIEQAD